MARTQENIFLTASEANDSWLLQPVTGRSPDFRVSFLRPSQFPNGVKRKHPVHSDEFAQDFHLFPYSG